MRDLSGGNRSETVCNLSQIRGRTQDLEQQFILSHLAALHWLTLSHVAALTFQMFLVSLQLRGQQATQGTQAAERCHNRVSVIHVGVVITFPAAQTTTITRLNVDTQAPITTNYILEKGYGVRRVNMQKLMSGNKPSIGFD